MSTLSWECSSGYSCYYDGHYGVNRIWVAPSCGWFNLGAMNPPLNDRISSIRNLGGGDIDLYNWDGVSRWIYLTTVPVGYRAELWNAWDNVVDAVSIHC